jgi:hypothetical protein
MLLLDALAELLPYMLFATTLNVYEVPLVNPLTEIGELAPVPVKLPGVEITV